jgi:hypothetical protein
LRVVIVGAGADAADVADVSDAADADSGRPEADGD